jgi:protein-disulfide isomerase
MGTTNGILKFIGAAVLGFTLSFGGVFAEEAKPEAATEETAEIVVPDMILGAEDAPITVIEYASFTCPHCARFHDDVFGKLKENYIDTGKVKFIHREIYFDKYGLWASVIARCAGADRYYGVSSLMYKGQSDWARAGGDAEIAEALKKIGRISGLNDEQLDSCLQDRDQVLALVGWFQENSERDGIRSTPSLLIDGELHSNKSYADLSEILDAKLDK